MNKSLVLMLASVMVLAAVPAFALEEMTMTPAADVALEEKLGQYLPADLVFTDENGSRVILKDLIDKPAVIAPVYLGCTHTCPLLLSGLAQTLGKLELVKPGKDFSVITVSFDEKDTPALAADRKRNYVKAVGRPFPADAWKFLTGDSAEIGKLTEAIGFRIQRDGKDFSHPISLVVVSSQGRIVRYLEGVSFLPFEMTMAVNEAAEGRVGSARRKALMYCFSYDPAKKSYVFNVLKVTGTAMVLFVGAFMGYLVYSTKKGSKTGR